MSDYEKSSDLAHRNGCKLCQNRCSHRGRTIVNNQESNSMMEKRFYPCNSMAPVNHFKRLAALRRAETGE